MGQIIPISKERGSHFRHAEDRLLTVDLDRFDEHIVEPFLDLLVEYWQIVNEEDLSTPYEYEIPGGRIMIPEARAMLYMLLNEGARVKLAYVGSDLVGFLIYHTVYRSSLVIRHLYSTRERSSTAKALVESALPEVKKLLFQTRKGNPPKRLLGLLKGARVLYEDDKLIDWEMQWL